MLGGCCGRHACTGVRCGWGTVSPCPAALAGPGVDTTAPEKSHPRKVSLTPSSASVLPPDHCLHPGDRKGHSSQAVSRSHTFTKQ